MDIPVYHNYTLSRAWELAKTQLVEANTPPKLSWLQKRSRCLKRMCNGFHTKRQEVLDKDDVEVAEQEPEDTAFVSPAVPAATSILTSSRSQVGLGHRSFSSRRVQVCQLGDDVPYDAEMFQEGVIKEHDLAHHIGLLETPVASEGTPANLWGILESERDLLTIRSQSQEEQPTDMEFEENIAMPADEPSAGAQSQMTSGEAVGEQLDGATEGFHAALCDFSLETIFESKPISAYFSYYSPEDGDEGYEPKITVSSPKSVSSEETLINTPERAISPQTLTSADSELAEDALQKGDEEIFDEKFSEELYSSTPIDEDNELILPPRCRKVEYGWKNIIKIVEDRQKLEIADKEDDFEGKKADLERDHGAAIEDLRNGYESKIADLEQKCTKASRELREKGKEVREQKRALKAMPVTLREKESLEEDHAAAIQDLQYGYTSQREKLEDYHKRALQEVQNKSHGVVHELRTHLEDESESLRNTVALVEEWKEIAEVLQAQHESFCNGGPSCMQQMDNLKLYINQQERAWRQECNYVQYQLHQTTDDKAVLQQEFEKSQEETKRAKLHVSLHESKWKNAVEGCRRAKELLNADDAKAASAHSLQQSANEIASLVIKNRTKAGEIQKVYQMAAESRALYDKQIEAAVMQIRRLNYENESLRTANLTLKSDVRSLRGQNQGLVGDINTFRTAYSNLSSAKTTLEGQKKGLEADNARLMLGRSNLQNEVNAFKAQRAEVQREKNTLKWNKDAFENRALKLGSENEALRNQINQADRLKKQASAAAEIERRQSQMAGINKEKKSAVPSETQAPVDPHMSNHATQAFSAATALPSSKPPIDFKADALPSRVVARQAQVALQEQLVTAQEDEEVPNSTDGDLEFTDFRKWVNLGFLILLAIWISVGHAILYKVTLNAVY